jgi:hypothetical protein
MTPIHQAPKGQRVRLTNVEPCALISSLANQFEQCRPLGCGDVPHSGLSAAGILFGVVADFLAFRQGTHPGPLKSRDVDKDIIAAVIRRYKSIAPLIAEEFHGAGVH